MEKIILVYYVNVGHMDYNDVSQHLKTISETFKDENMVQYFVPIKEGETRIDCLNPKLVTKEEYNNVKELLDKNQKLVNEFINS